MGGNKQVGDSVWLGIYANTHGSDGYVDRMDSESTNVTASLLWEASENFKVEIQADYLDDSLADYWGTPLVPKTSAGSPLGGVVSTSSGETVDARARFKNFNVSDSVAVSSQSLFRADLTWEVSDNIQLQNTTYRFSADREGEMRRVMSTALK